MSKALVGFNVDVGSVRLLEEIRSLRMRVAELEAALERAESPTTDAMPTQPE